MPISAKSFQVVCIGVSIVNGVLYFSISYIGAKRLESYLKREVNNTAQPRTLNNTLLASILNTTLLTHPTAREELNLAWTLASGLSSGVFALFYYDGIKDFTLINRLLLPKVILSLFTPFSAAVFLTAGKLGSEVVYSDPTAALLIGIVAYTFRVILSLIAAMKLVDRFADIKKTLQAAFKTKNWAEITRILTSLVSGFVYSLAITDSVYAAAGMIAGWAGIQANHVHAFSFTASLLGMGGIFPLACLTILKGISELTRYSTQTDRFSWLACLLVFPSILGTIGAVTSANGLAFGHPRFPPIEIKIPAAIIFGMSMGVPGMASLLRQISAHFKSDPIDDAISQNSQPMLTLPTPSSSTLSGSGSRIRFFPNALLANPSQTLNIQTSPQTSEPSSPEFSL